MKRTVYDHTTIFGSYLKQMKGLLKFLTSPRIWMHLTLIVIFAAVVLGLTMYWLNNYTRHGDSIVVPDLRGVYIDDIDEVLANNDLKYEITDSIYSNSFDRGVVVTQNPWANKAVKRERTIFLTVSRVLPEMVEVPELIGKSLRIAIPLLEITGLQMETLEYRPDDSCTDCVIGLKYNGEEIDAGTQIIKGAKVVVVLGQESLEKTIVPNVLGMEFKTAQDVIRAQSLNVGQVLLCTGCETSEDTAKAYIINQVPNEGEETNLGTFIDVFLSNDSAAASIFNSPKDTLK